MAGDQVGYLLGRRLGAALLGRLPTRMTRSGNLQWALDLVRRRGVVAVVLGRWTMALRALVPGIAGMSGMPYRTFAISNILGGAAWAGTVATVGFVAGTSYRILDRRLGLGGELLLAVVLALGLGWVLAARRRRGATGDSGTTP
ncbi:MAG: DedA family protein [Micromonosporaceae bacterium]